MIGNVSYLLYVGIESGAIAALDLVALVVLPEAEVFVAVK